MASLPYIGSKISLISNAEIRYEGTLYSIDTNEGTLALQDVQSYGTEGRKQPAVQPGAEPYQYIIFRGKDIKDLTVITSAEAPRDPAIVSMGKGGKGQKGGKGKKGDGKGKGKDDGWKGKGKGKGKGGDERRRGGRSRGDPRNPVGELIPQENAAANVGTDFDFTEASAVNAEKSAEANAECQYDKSKSFFDSISSNVHKPKDADKARFDRVAQRELDTATFGESALKRPFGRRMGRGRGY